MHLRRLAGLAALLPVMLCSVTSAKEQIKTSRIIAVPRDGAEDRGSVISSLALSPDGELLAGAGDDHIVRIWRKSDGRLVKAMRGHQDWVRSADFSPDGKTLVTAGEDSSIIFWDVAAGRAIRTLPLQSQAMYSLKFHPGGELLAGVGFQPKLQLYAKSGDHAGDLDCPGTDMRTVAFSPNGELLAASGRNGKVRVWRMSDRRPVFDIPADRRRIHALVFSPDSRLIASGGEGTEVRVWETATGREVAAFPSRPGKIFSLAFCGKSRLAVGGTHNAIRICDLSTGEISHELAGHKGSVASLVYDEKTNTLMSGSFDTSIRYWELKTVRTTDRGGFPPR